MKRLVISLCAVFLLLTVSGCERDYERETYTKDLNIAVEAEPTSVYALEEEITQIAAEYDEGGILTEAIAVFKGEEDIKNQKGTISFTFCRDDKESKRGTTVILTYDMYEKKVTKVSYDEGLGSFDESFTKPLWEDGKKAPFSELFKQIRSDSGFDKKLDGENITLTIEFTSENIDIQLI